MTTTTAHCKAENRSGFTLVEAMVTTALVSIVFAALFSSWGFIAKSNMSIANYVEMNTAGRKGLEVFARDVRTARTVVDFSSTGMTLVLDSKNGPVDVHYVYDQQAKTVSRSAAGSREVIFSDVEELVLSRFTVLDTPATNALETKLIQLELEMVKNVIARKTTKKIVSARYIMRNKRVGQ